MMKSQQLQTLTTVTQRPQLHLQLNFLYRIIWVFCPSGSHDSPDDCRHFNWTKTAHDWRRWYIILRLSWKRWWEGLQLSGKLLNLHLSQSFQLDPNKREHTQTQTHGQAWDIQMFRALRPFLPCPLNAVLTAESWNVRWLVSIHSSPINLDLLLRSNWMCVFLSWSQSEALFTLKVSSAHKKEIPGFCVIRFWPSWPTPHSSHGFSGVYLTILTQSWLFWQFIF